MTLDKIERARFFLDKCTIVRESDSFYAFIGLEFCLVLCLLIFMLQVHS